MDEMKAVIFDLGGVLVGFKQESFVRETLSYVPRPVNLDWTNPKVIEAHRQFELGKLSKRQFYNRTLPFMGKISFREFCRVWGAGIFVWRPAVAEFVKKLKRKGYKIGIISNCDAFSYPLIMGRYKLHRFVDSSAPSFKVHARKPSRAIFDAAVKGLKEKPENCVYVDDLQKYVKIARKFGLQALHYKNPTQLKKGLSKLGVNAN
ncbi:MAG: HAD-IA family hydrolase [Candidatus Diapherotrites archaeon]|uniref:HAD-IA family hydrolase n=1 Tax=Candidatus Iainarchaeum sp. TaxID=3101447 RepID=A0A939CA75_9ARCH|nr:HAD-IA family hydrolase [Candidatus Diapherotrites archaeon]